jgi:acetyl coenzyme A synthetase (ADP forming)-like protein
MNLDGFFYPASIAVIGASRKEGSLGRVFFDKLLHYGYTGKILPVNPQATDINGIPSYSSIEELPETPDLGIIMVRKDLAIEATEQCAKKGIKNIIMITAGFREVGREGIQREKALMKIIKKHSIMLVGPNCMGIINTDPKISMNASFSPTDPFQGNVAFLSQSGALGVAVLEMSKSLHLGFSLFISEGNKADLVDYQFLDYLAAHEKTRVVTLYLESIEETEKFRQSAIRLGRQKPVIALKAGTSAGGAKAASSHTGALASPDLATTALFRQCGIIRVETVEEMFNYALAFSNQPVPDGKRMSIITNAGGPAILATDAVEKYGLQMAELSDKTQKQLRTFLPEEASVANPVDMIASANEKTFRDTLSTVLKDNGVDAVFVIIVRPPVNTTPQMIAQEFKEMWRDKESTKPVFIILMAEKDEHCGLEVFQELQLPVYAYPEAAVKSMAIMLEYDQWRKKALGKVKKINADRAGLQHIFEAIRAEKREHPGIQDVMNILNVYEFPLANGKVIQSAREAINFQQDIGGPVAMKIESEAIIHKSDSGCVRINLSKPTEITAAFEKIMQNALRVTTADKISGMFVQEMISGGHELALGMKRDPNYGPMIMFGMGGIFIEIFNDVSFRIAPLTDKDAREMIREIKGFPILKGFRGQTGVDLTIIEESLLKLSQLSLDFHQIMELDLNPFIVAPDRKNCKIVDVRMKINLKK